MIIKSSLKDYNLTIHEDFSFINKLLEAQNALYVIDEKVYHLYYDMFFSKIPQRSLFLIKAVESKKTIETALEVCEVMTDIPAKKNAHLISFGGGIVQDITGFAANILYRGIHWTFIPTTLLAACDSCIGGKTSLNYKNYKNLLGTFFPPDELHICPLFFHTLSKKDFESGLGEVVKFNIMTGNQGLERMEQDLIFLLERDKEKLNEYVETSLIFKKKYIEEDEFDRGIRIHLNFAHTFGHAFESISNYAIPHGTAVAMGMLTANQISFSRGWISKEKKQRMENVLLQIIHIDVLNIDFNISKIISAIQKDKKQIDSSLTAVLMNDSMELKLVHDLTIKEINMAIKYLFCKLQ